MFSKKVILTGSQIKELWNNEETDKVPSPKNLTVIDNLTHKKIKLKKLTKIWFQKEREMPNLVYVLVQCKYKNKDMLGFYLNDDMKLILIGNVKNKKGGNKIESSGNQRITNN